jgi:hypothetical protein
MAIELKQCLSLYHMTELFVGEIAKKKNGKIPKTLSEENFKKNQNLVLVQKVLTTNLSGHFSE